MAHYDQIGGGYDATRRADPDIAWRLQELLGLPAGWRCLDVGCGTGSYTLALAAAGLQMVGVDVSRHMLEAARAKKGAARWVLGDAIALPFREGAFMGAVCTLAVHHFPAMGPAFAEVARVLDAGRFVLFTDDPQQMRGYWLNEYFPEMMVRSICQMPPIESVVAALRRAGFGAVAVEP
jgi:ubiquinone/menaquinone biosynthesis C-methylase UbiE